MGLREGGGVSLGDGDGGWGVVGRGDMFVFSSKGDEILSGGEYIDVEMDESYLIL